MDRFGFNVESMNGTSHDKNCVCDVCQIVNSEDWLSEAINVAENFDAFIKLITGSTATQLLQNEYEHTIKNLIKFRKHQIGKVYVGDN